MLSVRLFSMKKKTQELVDLRLPRDHFNLAKFELKNMDILLLLFNHWGKQLKTWIEFLSLEEALVLSFCSRACIQIVNFNNQRLCPFSGTSDTGGSIEFGLHCHHNVLLNQNLFRKFCAVLSAVSCEGTHCTNQITILSENSSFPPFSPFSILPLNCT